MWPMRKASRRAVLPRYMPGPGQYQELGVDMGSAQVQAAWPYSLQEEVDSDVLSITLTVTRPHLSLFDRSSWRRFAKAGRSFKIFKFENAIMLYTGT